MTWFKVDDGLPDHRKVRQLKGDKAAAMGVWVLCGAWSASNLSDGFVPAEIVARYDPRQRYAARLVEVGLWEPAEQNGEAGFLFHDWADVQPTKREVETRREEVRRRVAKHRKSKSAGPERPDPNGGPQPGNAASNATGNALHDEPVTPDVLTGARACAGVPSRPVPTRPTSGHPAAAPSPPERARGGGEHVPAAELDRTASSGRGYVLVTRWADTQLHRPTSDRIRKLIRVVDDQLRRGGEPELIPAALDRAHDPHWRDPVAAFPHAYDDVRRRACAPPPDQARWTSTTDERVAQAQALKALFDDDTTPSPPPLLMIDGGAA